MRRRALSFARLALSAGLTAPTSSTHSLLLNGGALHASCKRAAAALPGASSRAALLPEAARALKIAAMRSRFHSASTAFATSPEAQATHTSESWSTLSPVYKEQDLQLEPAHRPVDTLRDKVAYSLVQLMRYVFDKGTGYGSDVPMTEARWLQRIIFLETVAALPGMVGGAVRHLHSLRLMKRDSGWIHTLLEEAENERMHLLTFIQLRQPGLLFRGAVLLTQGIVFNALFAAYLLSPKTCHRFVGYLEEEAVKTYTRAIADLDAGLLPAWKDMAAPPLAMEYWKLRGDATMRDLLLAVRADEAAHSHVNHTLASLGDGAVNPFRACGSKEGYIALPKSFVEPPPGIDLLTGMPKEPKAM